MVLTWFSVRSRDFLWGLAEDFRDTPLIAILVFGTGVLWGNIIALTLIIALWVYETGYLTPEDAKLFGGAVVSIAVLVISGKYLLQKEEKGYLRYGRIKIGAFLVFVLVVTAFVMLSGYVVKN